jgi:hypothetical protein
MQCEIQAQQNFMCLLATWGSNVEVRVPPSSPCPRLSKYLIKLNEVRFGGTVFELKQMIQVALYQEDSVWYCENEELAILAFGDTAEQAVHSFCEDFSVLWEEIAVAPDDSLTSDAQKVKQNLRSVVKSVKVGKS